MPPKNDLFSLLEDADNLSKTDLEVYIASIRDIIVEKKDPYYTIAKGKIHELLNSETPVDELYAQAMLIRIGQIKRVYTSEARHNTLDIFSDFVMENKLTAITKEGILYLNGVWKARP